MKRQSANKPLRAQRGARRVQRCSELEQRFADRLSGKTARIAVIGLGYVGLPLACVFAEKGFHVLGFDIDDSKVELINRGKSYIRHIPSARFSHLVKSGIFEASSDPRVLKKSDAVIICVPTPLTKFRDPDLTYIVATAEALAEVLQPGQLVVLESSTYPGTTMEVLRPILEKSGLRSGKDFFLAYSPEREDPGNETFGTAAIPKVVGGDGPAALRLAKALYDHAVVKTVPVSSPDAGEAIKLTENIFRAVNIALVNELKVIFDAMGIDVWEVIDGAKSKPFGFMPFYPGPGLGGHCIPIDPFYLTWKARAFGINTRFIELAGEINTHMPRYVVNRLVEALSSRAGKPIKNAEILIIGLAYKKNIDDMRESPTLVLLEMLEGAGARVHYHDPLIPRVKPSREHGGLTGRRSVALDRRRLESVDAVLVSTDHDPVDYALIAKHAKLIIDTRNAFARRGLKSRNLVKA